MLFRIDEKGNVVGMKRKKVSGRERRCGRDPGLLGLWEAWEIDSEIYSNDGSQWRGS